MTLRSQRLAVRSLLHLLPPEGQLGFGLGMVERMTLLSQRVFPEGVPPLELRYGDILKLIDRLWSERLEFDDPDAAANLLRAGQGRDSQPEFENGRGLVLGWYITESLSRLLEGTEQPEELEFEAIWVWAAVCEVLLQRPRRVSDQEPSTEWHLSGDRNGAILAEFTLQSIDLADLRMRQSVDRMRERNREVIDTFVEFLPYGWVPD